MLLGLVLLPDEAEGLKVADPDRIAASEAHGAFFKRIWNRDDEKFLQLETMMAVIEE